MDKRLILLQVFLLIFLDQKAQVTKTDKGIILKNFGCNTHLLKIEAISSQIIHLVASPTTDQQDGSLDGFDASDLTDFSIKIDSERIVLKTDYLRVIIDPRDGRVTFRDNHNSLLLEENSRFYKPYHAFVENAWSVKQEFKWASDEALYDMDLQNGGLFNIRGKNLDLIIPGSKMVDPLIVSSKGYGIVWYNNSLSRYNDDSEGSYLWSEVADRVNYYFLYGPSSEEVVSNYRKLTGNFLLLPKWAMDKQPVQTSERQNRLSKAN
ncbi:MAG TPA: hypothetical protein VIH57_16875 [Bacteroidales bacterium]